MWLSAYASPRATVPATGGRMARPSANSGFATWVLNFGWKSMSQKMWIGRFGLGVARMRAKTTGGISARQPATRSE